MNNQYDGWAGRQDALSENAFTNPTALCPRVDLWSAPDDMSSECEVTDFLYSLVRLLKPKIVLETGCFLGATSGAIGHALKRNKYGRLITCDVDPGLADHVTKLARRLRLPIDVLHADSSQAIRRLQAIDLAFVDSGEDRPKEILSLIPKMSAFGIIALHDTAPHHRLVEHDYFESRGLKYIYMNTPRGLTLLQRRAPQGAGL
jgi:predicted O-methyltransferase YrrM